jgi:hypothetical protein
MDATLAQILETQQNLVALIAAERREKAALAEERDRLKDLLAECDHEPVHLLREEAS